MIETENTCIEIEQRTVKVKKVLSWEALIFLIVSGILCFLIGRKMGGVNMVSTVMKTSYDLLFSTAFFILSVAVLAGALSELLQEFGVIAAANKVLSPVVKPLFGMPGASMIGVFTTYLSDNPAILTFSNNPSIRRFYKRYQLPALTNLGTAFGMGMIVTAFVIGMRSPSGEPYIKAAVIGNIAAIFGAVISTRLMLVFTARLYGKEEQAELIEGADETADIDIFNYRIVRDDSLGSRLMSAALDGGRVGVNLGIAIIPGILIITTIVLILTNGPSLSGEYTGAAYEGIGLLPYLGNKIDFILKPLFGFSHPEAIAVPLTALGAAGAAISIMPQMVHSGILTAHDIAVCTAMCMCFSGYLCTHVVMMQSIGARELTGKALLSHTVGGVGAGIFAHLIYTFL